MTKVSYLTNKTFNLHLNNAVEFRDYREFYIILMLSTFFNRWRERLAGKTRGDVTEKMYTRWCSEDYSRKNRQSFQSPQYSYYNTLCCSPLEATLVIIPNYTSPFLLVNFVRAILRWLILNFEWWKLGKTVMKENLKIQSISRINKWNDWFDYLNE